MIALLTKDGKSFCVRVLDAEDRDVAVSSAMDLAGRVSGLGTDFDTVQVIPHLEPGQCVEVKPE